MLTLAGQVQQASDTAKFAACRLTVVQPPICGDMEASFAELQARLDLTVQYLDQFHPAQFEESVEWTVTLSNRGTQRVFDGKTYLLGFALPSFYFHATTAYDVLHHRRVRIRKNDYLGQVGR